METTRLEADDDTRATIPDDDAGEWAICELVQRDAWAAELGLDPRGVDLLALATQGRSAPRRRGHDPVG